MIGTLYRYPHPNDPARYIYVGQGPKRDVKHRLGIGSFGRRFKKLFPDTELPQPIRELVEVRDYLELNELETIWMFQYHTWHGYDGGMNLVLPGSLDYKNMGKVGGRIAGRMNAENKTGFCGRTPERMSEIGRKYGGISGRMNAQSGHCARIASLGGHVQGRKSAENKTGVCGRAPEKMSKDGRKAMHVRWHIKRNKTNLNCDFCREEVGAAKRFLSRDARLGACAEL